jgi:hypothetical protein
MASYTSFREIYDVNGLFIYIKATLPTLQSISYNSGTITTTFSSSLSAGDQTTLANLVSNYSNPQVLINQNNFRQISVGNSTTTPLAGNAVFTGAWEDVSDYGTVTVLINANTLATTNGLKLQFSSDQSTVDFEHGISIQAGGDLGVCSVVGRYFRVVVTNGAASQSTLRVQTIYTYYLSVQPQVTLSDSISDDAVVGISRNVLTGKTTNGKYINTKVFPDGGIAIDATKTVFGNLLVDEPFPVLQKEFSYTLNTQVVSTTTTGSGTVTQATSFANIASGAAINSSAQLVSKRTIRYRPGQGSRTTFGCIFAAGAAGNTQIAGIGNPTDGLFFGFNGTSFGILHRNNTVETWIPKTTWNIDKMDGTGLSGVNLDVTKGNVYLIQFQWHGFGTIRFWIEETTTGRFHEVHRIQYANANTTASMSIPYFTFLAQSVNTTNNTNQIIKLTAFSSLNEGIARMLGPRFGVDNSKTLSATSNTAILSIRNRTTFNSLTNRISIHLRDLSASTDTRQAVVSFIRNTTLGGVPSWTNVNTSDSVIEFDTAATTATGGVVLFSICLGTSTGTNQQFQIYDITLEPGDTITACARIPANSNTVVSVAFNWVEDQ